MHTARWAACLCALWATGCFAPRYLAQAAYGQLRMYSDRVPISQALTDPDISPEHRRLLGQVADIRGYAEAAGLATHGSYRAYVDVNRSASVWFVAASKPLSFEPKTWCFPIVGCFPMLGWFELDEARRFRSELMEHGWEVYLRGATAYSTAGWFKDAIVSTMLGDGDDAIGDLANVVFHELVHANLLIPDQSYFNESVAAFIGDGLAAAYLRDRYGADSVELQAYLDGLDLGDQYAARMLKAYDQLDRLYKSDRSDRDKLARKKKILAALEADVPFLVSPNNATLIGIRTYRLGVEEFTALLDACGGDWPAFIRAIERVEAKWFDRELQEEFGPVVRPLIEAGCKPAAKR